MKVLSYTEINPHNNAGLFAFDGRLQAAEHPLWTRL